jgi:hypothetical protein
MINRNLTHLSLDLVHISLAIVLMPFVPALEHFELRLHNVYNQVSVFESEFLEKRVEWPTKVRSLRLIAYKQLIDTTSFYAFLSHSIIFRFISVHLNVFLCPDGLT